ncbi:MAG: Hsp70 family protein [Bacteroides sp.]|nr:Hsp70 family protein [Bacteroides sp.]
MSKTIGIDLGTTNSVVAFKDASVRVIATGPNNEDLCRSCVAMDRSGSFVVGNSAYKSWKRYAPNIVVSAKRLMGASITDPQVQKMKNDKDMYPYGISKKSGGTEDSVAIIMNGQEFSPEQISAQILRQLKEDASVKLGDEVTHAVITVPAYFNEKQKAATRKAAELAGLKVQRLLAEPTAAAISYGADKMSADEDKIFLVYDFGGGTFDLSVLVASGGSFIESGTGGDRWLGGDDIDRLVSEYVLTEAGKANNIDMHKLIESQGEKKKYAFQGEFKNEVESAKKLLSQPNTDSVTISVFGFLETEDGDDIDIEVTLTRDTFESMIRPLVQRTIDLIDELLEKTAYPIDSIDNILLVGGSSCIPLVRNMLSEKYGKDKILFSEKPMLAIAEGAAILSHSMGTEFECPHCGKSIPVGSDECPYCHKSMESSATQTSEDPVKTGVVFTTKHKYFIETRDDADNVQYSMIIDENQVLPNEVNGKFYTLVDNQKIIAVNLYSDAENGGKEKIGTGFFTIAENLPVHSELQFTFRLTEDETMSVKVRVPSTGKIHNINYSRGNLDSHCFEAIQNSFDRVVGDPSISDSQKNTFIDKLQKIIEGIQVGTLSAESKDWQKIEDTVKNATTAATAKDDGLDVNVIITKILLDNFGKFMSPDHKDAMRRELTKYDDASTPMQKEECARKLETLNENYGLFVSAFLLNIAGHDDSNPVRANKALVAYNQFMSALNEGNVSRAREILDANRDLMGSIPSGPGGGTTGLGK